MPAEEDEKQLGREIRFFLTSQMGTISHRKMKDLLTRFRKCWKPTMCYHEMITFALKQMDDLEHTKEYTRYKLVDVCKYLLPPDGYVHCVNLLYQNQALARMKEHAVEHIRTKMHKNLGYDMRQSNAQTKYYNCGDLPKDLYLRYFNNTVHARSQPEGGQPKNNKKPNSGGDQQNHKKAKTDTPKGKGNGKTQKTTGMSKNDFQGLIKELKNQGMHFENKKETNK